MADKNKNPYGYDIVNEVDLGGKYLSFGKGDKGRVIKMRLVSEPKYLNRHWILDNEGNNKPIKCTGDDCPYCGKDVADKVRKDSLFGWIVIDRADGVVKVFTGPKSIAFQIRDLTEDEDWGDPFLYDIKITRTEEQGRYYVVTPTPDGKGKEITKEEKEEVKKANFDLEKELEGGKASKSLGNYKNDDLETVDNVADLVKDDKKEKAVPDEDKIPF